MIFLHVNIRSLEKNYNELNQIISELPIKPLIICTSETKLKDIPDVHSQSMFLFMKIPQLMLAELEFTFQTIYALRKFVTLNFLIVKVYGLMLNLQILAIHM